MVEQRIVEIAQHGATATQVGHGAHSRAWRARAPRPSAHAGQRVPRPPKERACLAEGLEQGLVNGHVPAAVARRVHEQAPDTCRARGK